MIGNTNINGSANFTGRGALLRIHAPTGSIVTASKGEINLTIKKSIVDLKNSNFSYYFLEIRPFNFGEWTITGEKGEEISSETIEIDTIKVYEIDIMYYTWIYKNGQQFTDITGGWVKYVSGNNQANTGITIFRDNYISFSSNYVYQQHLAYGGFGTENKIDLTNYNELIVVADASGTDYSNLFMQVGVNSAWKYQPIPIYFTDAIITLVEGERQITTLNISTITGAKWVGIGASAGGANNDVISNIYMVGLK